MRMSGVFLFFINRIEVWMFEFILIRLCVKFQTLRIEYDYVIRLVKKRWKQIEFGKRKIMWNAFYFY